MSTALTNVIAMIIAMILAIITAYGVVASQQSAGEKVDTTQVSYGNK